MNKNNTKKLIIILTAAVILLAALGITAAVGVYKLIMGTATGSDRYLEQMLEAAETGDRSAIASHEYWAHYNPAVPACGHGHLLDSQKGDDPVC